MQPTTTLRAEHRVIERVLSCLEAAVDRARAGHRLNPEFFLDAATFAQGYTDGCHHKKEERVLFPALTADDPTGYGGLVSAMLADHEQGRKYVRAMREAAQRLSAGDDSAAPAVLANAQDYCELLRAHIHAEDTIVFKIAERVLTFAQQERIGQECDLIEHAYPRDGGQQTYVRLAGQLERQAAH